MTEQIPRTMLEICRGEEDGRIYLIIRIDGEIRHQILCLDDEDLEERRRTIIREVEDRYEGVRLKGTN